MFQQISQLVDIILAPLMGPIQAESRIFWVHLISALGFVLLIKHRRSNLSKIFSSKTWLHRSSLLDIKLIFANSIIKALVFPSTVILIAGFSAVVSLSLKYLLGPSPEISGDHYLILGSFTLAMFIADDFARFFLHWCQHKIGFLWRFHKIHHSAEVLTPLTLYRSHPIDILLARVRDMLSGGLITGIFFYLCGPQLSGWDILGVNSFSFLFNFAGANLRHSMVWLHFAWLEPIFLSPAAHQIHHGKDEKYYDKNFGVCFTLWDRLFGSYTDPRKEEAVREYGLKEGAPSNLWQAYLKV